MSRINAPIMLLLLSGVARADLSDQLEVCAAVEDAESRLACFDAIGRNAPVAPPGPAEPAPGPRSASAAEDAPVQKAEPVPEAPSIDAVPSRLPKPVQAAPPSAEEFGLDSMTAREREELERQRVQEERQAKADEQLAENEREANEKELEKERRRAEKEAKKREREQVVQAKITRVIEHLDGRFSVVLDNGQIWRETQGSKVGIPDAGASVELKRGRFGGYRMNIDGLYQTAWVKRTE